MANNHGSSEASTSNNSCLLVTSLKIHNDQCENIIYVKQF